VDRGAPPEPKVRQVLAHYLGRPDAEDAPWLAEHALALLGMVDADATEVDVGAYLRQVARGLGRAPDEVAGARMAAVALWHVVKAARMRDLAERAVRGELRCRRRQARCSGSASPSACSRPRSWRRTARSAPGRGSAPTPNERPWSVVRLARVTGGAQVVPARAGSGRRARHHRRGHQIVRPRSPAAHLGRPAVTRQEVL
jgi:hypothetical protein